MQRRVVESLAVAVLLGAGVARAEAPPVWVGVSGCNALDEKKVRRLLAIELRSAPAEQAGPGITFVGIRCVGLQVVVRVEDPLTRKTVERSFDLGALEPGVRARLVALAASELVLSSWTELETNPSPRVPPSGPEPESPVRMAARAVVREKVQALPTASPARVERQSELSSDTELASRARFFRVLGVASMRTFFGSSHRLWGGGVRLSEERFAGVSWSADALVESGTVQTELRRYSLRTGTVGGWLLLYQRSGPLIARLGAGLRMGLIATAPGDTEGGGAAVAPWGWPLAATSLAIELPWRLAMDLSGEVGYVVLPLPGARESSLRGSWFSLQLGLGFAP
ncbi:MAG TPA: hypothetical protein VKY73_05035 [Polyangiaceae bacterium]|nr:hypothetical protein [Polyangiaceae bacterium]